MTHPYRRRSSALGKLLLVAGIVLVSGAATVGTLWALGIDLAFWRRGPQILPGSVAVPVSAQVIPAYTKLTRVHIVDRETRQVKYIYLPRGAVTQDMLTDFKKILGRVLNHEKPADYAFTEKDFLPEGTRPGLVAGIPSGKRSLTLEAGKLAGVFGLKVGDHVDLVATVPFDSSKGGGRIAGLAGTLATQTQMAAMEKRARVRPLAQDAVIVSPVTTRNKPTTSSSLTGGTQVRSVPVQEIVIAVDPQEVAALSEAIATHAEITCVARSGLPDDPGQAVKTPGADPLSEMKVIDSISGKNRQALVFSSGDSRLITDGAPAANEAATLGAPDGGLRNTTPETAK